MQLKYLIIAALASAASAQNLTSVLSGNSNLTQLNTYVSLFPQLVSQLSSASNITLLAPSNAAFSKLLNSSAAAGLANNTAEIQAILTYHVLNGTYPASAITNNMFIPTMLNNASYSNVTGGQVVEAGKSGSSVIFTSGLKMESTVTTANVNFTGGIIHIIDTVLTPPLNVSTTAVDANLTSLTGALTMANLVSTVDTTPELTIFAPNNAAFQNIGSATGNLSTAQLTSVLEYHVIKGAVGYSSTLKNGTSLQTLGGANVTITINNGTVFVNSAKVLIPDVLVANGVVHVIDNVLNPNATSIAPNPTASTQPVAFSGASSATMVPFTSGQPTPTMTLGGGLAGTTGGTTASSAAAGGAKSSSSKAAAAAAWPMKTGAVGVGALFGAGVAWMAV
ncbi:MAG: hypothetical protein M1827_003085 [Pycnora praestabilis]|nr:MAG: hypothetical protein M1827_003085 [Pycnora praestabilis]